MAASRCRLQLCFLCCLFVSAFVLKGADSSSKLTFEADVSPILTKRCVVCHGDSGPQADLNLTTVSGLLDGGKTGPAVAAGSAEHSLLIAKVVSGAMPPVGDKLTADEVATLRAWIDQGAQTTHRAGLPALTEKDVVPIFQMRCATCHGKRRREGDLDLRTLASRLKGGRSGPAIVPGSPDESLAFQRITAGEMPPPDMLFENQVRPPSSEEVEVLRRWIAGGARADEPRAPAPPAEISEDDRQFPAFRPPLRPTPPVVKGADRVRNPVDQFLLAKLEEKGLSYSSPAERLTLLRRVYLDLIGMPPTPAEAEAFLADDREDAYERLIDRLLASRHYGEKWAQVWLDLAGYSDSEGIIDEDRVRPHAWRYRDYVIRAFNSDKPYDRFFTEQLAGDELIPAGRRKDVTPEMVDTLAATGFLRMTPDGTYSPANGSLAERMTGDRRRDSSAEFLGAGADDWLRALSRP